VVKTKARAGRGVQRPRDGLVLVLSYGMDGGEPLSLREVGQRLGISVSRVQQLRARAIRRMRRVKGAPPW